ncbi:MAG: M56 family metallopeptidase [Sphingopyxis sp.]
MTMPPLADWMLDTLIATTLLCALVLTVRRPVARAFGPGLAYALWLLPAFRMVLPPLPAFLPSLSALWPAPASPPSEAMSGIEIVLAAPPPAASLAPVADGWPSALPIVWLGGAVLHLGWQYITHRRLLSALRDAETVDWKGRIRIVSSAAVSGPLSLGLFNPMIVLPDDSRMVLDAAERDLAIAHELAHHARGDLWANGAAVLFAALHWFNPVVLYAWRAFRFDQESACDAKVLAGADARRRGTYARALAKAASGRSSAFAASMMGSEKLKERLTMLIQPTRSKMRRRLGLGLGAALLIGSLGLTASTALADPAETPATPTPPAVTADGALTVDRSREGAEEVTRIVDGDSTTIILRTDHALSQAEIDRLVAQAHAARADAEVAAGSAAATAADRQAHTVIIRQSANGASENIFPTPPEPPVPPTVPGERRSAHRIVVRHPGAATEPTCPSGSEPLVDVHETGGNGPDRATVRIFNCANASATRETRLRAVRAARESLADADSTMVRDLGDVRLRALAVLDAQIAELERAGN